MLLILTALHAGSTNNNMASHKMLYVWRVSYIRDAL